MIQNKDKFDCNNCPWNRHCDDSNPSRFPQWVIPDVIESNICLLPMMSDWHVSMWRLYSHYKNQLLPKTGGLFDQPNLYLEAMEVIDNRVNFNLTQKKNSKKSHDR